jgi:hypothetical protein
MPQHAQKAAAQACKPCKRRYLWLPMQALQCPGHRHSGRRQARSGAETRSSKQHKLARVKAAARASRRDCRMQEEGHNSLHPWDFEARGPRRASAKSPRLERRTSANRSPCGRRTSLQDGARRFLGCVRATLPTVYPDNGSDAIAFHKCDTENLALTGPAWPQNKPARHRLRWQPDPGSAAPVLNDAVSYLSESAPYPRPSFSSYR